MRQVLWGYRELFRNLVLKDLRLKYRGSWLGVLWSLLHPLLMIAVYWLAFEYIISFRVKRFPLFLLVGIFHWQAFHQAIKASGRAIVGNANLIKQALFPHELLPLAIAISSFLQLFFALVIMIPILGFVQHSISWNTLFYLPAALLHLTFTVGVALAVAALTVFYRDLEHLMDVGLRLLFWLTPVIYPFSIVPKGLARVLQFNPLVPFIITYQDLLYGGRPPEGTRWFVMVGWAGLSFLAGYIIFRRYQPRFAEEV